LRGPTCKGREWEGREGEGEEKKGGRKGREKGKRGKEGCVMAFGGWTPLGHPIGASIRPPRKIGQIQRCDTLS